MKLKDKQKYEEWKAKNKDGYGRYAERKAHGFSRGMMKMVAN